MYDLAVLQPQRLFSIFKQICEIPHGSGHTQALSAWCEAFIKGHGLVCRRDTAGNVIAYKPGSPGRENQPPMILQAHLDMVCVKTEASTFDFERDSLQIETDGGYIRAKDTTLGADDGIGVAMILAVLADETLSHPPLEAVLTADEETGMEGACALDFSCFQGRRLINLDSEEEGIFTAGCAGGVRLQATLPMEQIPNEWPGYRLQLFGLTGGHSGTEIHKDRQNANHVLAHIMNKLYEQDALRLTSFDGGEKDNAIPRSAECRFVCLIPEGSLLSQLSVWEQQLKTKEDPGVQFRLTAEKLPLAWSQEVTGRFLNFMSAVPDGVQAMCADMPDQVETSLNLGVITTEQKGITALFSLRSALESEKRSLLLKLQTLTTGYGGYSYVSGNYPAWEFQPQSSLRACMTRVYRAYYQKEPVVQVIHAGLECGLFCQKCPALEVVSVGPDINGAHTPKEQLSIASASRTYEYLCRCLAAL